MLLDMALNSTRSANTSTEVQQTSKDNVQQDDKYLCSVDDLVRCLLTLDEWLDIVNARYKWSEGVATNVPEGYVKAKVSDTPHKHDACVSSGIANHMLPSSIVP